MEPFFTLIAFIAFSLNLFAQQTVEWIKTQQVGWENNPAFTEHLVTTDGTGRNITARFVSNVVTYGELFGNYVIEARDAAGNVQMSFPLTGKIFLQTIAADNGGNVYIGGGFMETIHFGSNDSLVNTSAFPDTFNIDGFILKINAGGSLVWKRNLSAGYPELKDVRDIRMDPQGNAWFTWSEWNTAKIMKLDANSGNDVGTPLVITGTRGISNFDFDPQGGVYLAGAADGGIVMLGNMAFTAPFTYNTYIARFDAQGNPAWVKFAHDETFQFPKVEADPYGNAFVGGSIFSETAWGAIAFHPHQWGSDFFLVKVNQQGEFIWGQQMPLTGSITGDIEAASGKFIATDTAGHVYLLGNQRGTFDWGNGIKSGDDGEPLWKTKLLFMKFDGATGQPLFAKTTAVGSTFAHEIATDIHKNIYFTQTIFDTTDYDFHHVEIPMYENTFVLGKITQLQDTSITISVNDVATRAFLLYPNPASASIVVPHEMRGSDVIVTDLTGKQIACHQRVGNTLNVEALASGFYVLVFRSERGMFTGRLIKE